MKKIAYCIIFLLSLLRLQQPNIIKLLSERYELTRVTQAEITYVPVCSLCLISRRDYMMRPRVLNSDYMMCTRVKSKLGAHRVKSKIFTI